MLFPAGSVVTLSSSCFVHNALNFNHSSQRSNWSLFTRLGVKFLTLIFTILFILFQLTALLFGGMFPVSGSGATVPQSLQHSLWAAGWFVSFCFEMEIIMLLFSFFLYLKSSINCYNLTFLTTLQIPEYMAVSLFVTFVLSCCSLLLNKAIVLTLSLVGDFIFCFLTSVLFCLGKSSEFSVLEATLFIVIIWAVKWLII